MILSNVNIGTGPSSGDGDPLRSAFATINTNFQKITGNVNALTNSVRSVAGRTGNVVLTVNDVIGLNTVYSTQANVTAANIAMRGYVDYTIAANISALVNAAPSTLDTIRELADAVGDDPNFAVNIALSVSSANTKMRSYVDGQITAANAGVVSANIGIKGYVDNSITTANIGIIGYIDQSNTIQASVITQANLGMKGYVDAINTTLTSNAAVQAGLIADTNTAITTANTAMKGYVDSQSFYSNAKVASYLPTYSGNIAGNISKNGYAWTFGTDGTLTFPLGSGSSSGKINPGVSDGGGLQIEAEYDFEIKVTQFEDDPTIWSFAGNDITFPDGSIQSTAWTGSVTTDRLVNGEGQVVLGSTGILTVPGTVATPYGTLGFNEDLFTWGLEATGGFYTVDLTAGDPDAAQYTATLMTDGVFYLPETAAANVSKLSSEINNANVDLVLVGGKDVRIESDGTSTNKTWTFDGEGNLTVPGSVIFNDPGKLSFLDPCAAPLSIGSISSVANIAFGDNTYQTTAWTGTVDYANVTSAYGNTEVATYLSSYNGSITFTASPAIISGLGTITTLDANITANLTAQRIYSDNFYYANGTPISFGSSSYGNAEVATYLPTYSGNITSNSINATGSISANGSVNTGGNLNFTGVETSDTARIFTEVSGSNTSMVLEVGDDNADRIALRHYSFAAGTTLDMLSAQRSSDTEANVTIIGNLITTNQIIATGNIVATVEGFAIGYKEVPQVAAGNVTLALSDSGKHYYSSAASPTTLTIPSNANVAFPIGTAISIVNSSTGNITIGKQAEANLYLAGNAVNTTRTLTSYGMATVLKTATDQWFISGSGLE